MKKWICFLLAAVVCLSLCACGSGGTEQEEKDPDALTEEEFERVKAVFSEYVGKELEYEPVYCGEWREGKQYKTENYAYGQFLINMDVDGYVHLVVWVEDGNREVMYNRLEDENAKTFVPTDSEAIYLVDGELGEYGQEVTIPSVTYGEYTYVWYNVPAGTYSVVYEGSSSRATMFVVGDADSADVRAEMIFLGNGATQEVTVEEDSHVELTVGAIFSMTLIE